MPTLDRIFGLLDDWRHLPCYQLERRADIFFAPFLPDFLEQCLHIRINPTLIPEFPLRQQGNNRSCKADYLALAADRSAAWLVELKTDDASRRAGQDQYLEDAQDAGLQKLVDGVLGIAQASSARGKYAHLLLRLHSLGLIRIPADLLPREGEPPSPNLSRQTKTFDITCGDIHPQIIYLQPTAGTDDGKAGRMLTFDQLAEFLARYEDPIARRFRESLRAWAKPLATRCLPVDEKKDCRSTGTR
jgi:hypothetical protein